MKKIKTLAWITDEDFLGARRGTRQQKPSQENKLEFRA